MGNSRRVNISGSINNIETYNEILMYTSYAYLTGKRGLTQQEVMTLRENAKMAKSLQRNNDIEIKTI